MQLLRRKISMLGVVEEHITICAAKIDIWSVLIDVPEWSMWDFEVTQSHLHGDFAVGCTGYLLDGNGSKCIFKITQIQHGESYSNVYPLAWGSALHFTHRLLGEYPACQVIFEAKYHGLLSIWYFFTKKLEIKATMRNALRNLKNKLETNAKNG